MSDSDDTDLLLVIPPDFFVIPSDSEDSIENYKKSNNDERFEKLASQVNELKERVNFIEYRDSNLAGSLSETSHVIHSADNSLSFETTNQQNLYAKDVSLQIYSLESTGFHYEGIDNVPGDDLEFFKVNTLSHKSIIPYNVSPMCTSSFQRTANYVSHLNSNDNAISVESSNQVLPPSKSLSLIQSDAMIADEIPSESLYNPYSLNTSFLEEIDKFLEGKNMQIKDNLHLSFPFDVSNQEKIKLCRQSNSDSAGKRKPFDEGLRDTVLKHPVPKYFSHPNLDLISCAVDPVEQKHWDKYNQDLSESHKKQSMTCNLNCDRSSFVQDFMSTFSSKGDSVLTPCKASGNPRLVEKKPNIVYSQDENAPYFLTSQLRDREGNNVGSLASYDRKDIGSENLMRHDDLIHKNYIQYNPSISQNGEKSSDSESSVDLPLRKDQTPHFEKRSSDKDTIVTIHSRNVSKSNDAARFRESTDSSATPNSCKYLLGERQNFIVDKSSHIKMCNRSAKSSCPLESKIQPLKLLERKNVPLTSLNTDDEGELARNKKLVHNEEGNNVLTNGAVENGNGLKDIGLFNYSEQSFPTTSKLKNHITIDPPLKQNEENLNRQRCVGDDGKNVGPGMMDDGYYSSIGTGSSAINLLSLSDLWSREGKEANLRNDKTLEQKLEEEFCRRKHCERVIQQLQSNILEQQQKIAFAVKVDRSKDKTILQLQTAWKHLASHWQELEEQRNSVSIQLSEEKEIHKQSMMEISLKVKQLELELSKALDLAKSFKEKNEVIEQKLSEEERNYVKEKYKLQKQIEDGQSNLLEAEKNLETLNKRFIEMTEKLEISERNASKEKELAMKYQKEVEKIQQSVSDINVEMNVVKDENASLRLRLKEERSRNDILDTQIKSLKFNLDEIKKREKTLEKDLREHSSVLEKTKTDLRDYYQQQVETVVQEKLVEFQSQLDAAEASLHQEMEQKEKHALEAASKQIMHITEKNRLEIKLLEEKHQEELCLCKLQLSQANKQINELQEQLQSHSNRKVEIVEKLHTVMETQWQEALRIISGNSPIQLQQQQNVEKDTSMITSDKEVRTLNDRRGNEVPPLCVQHSSSSSTTDEIPFNKEDQLTYRANNDQYHQRSDSFSNSADAVKKYIEMLLNRPPGTSFDQEVSPDYIPDKHVASQEKILFPSWEKLMQENQRFENDREKWIPCTSSGIFQGTEVQSNHKCKGKPPWK